VEAYFLRGCRQLGPGASQIQTLTNSLDLNDVELFTMFTLTPWPTRQMQRFQIYCRGILQVQRTWLFSTRLPRERRIYYSLCYGLRKLTMLESMKSKESWGCWHAGQYSISKYRLLYGIGSPLFRFWNPFHAYPGSWHIGLSLDLDPVHDADGPWQFWLLNYALSQTRRTFRTFKHAH